jgi:hypothetical protein
MLLLSSATDELIRDPILYFLDGNVVLAAEMADGSSHAFRVHQSVLSLHSSVFSDMFSMPGAGEDSPTDETYDGVPLVYMPDHCEDLKAFLKVLYDPS